MVEASPKINCWVLFYLAVACASLICDNLELFILVLASAFSGILFPPLLQGFGLHHVIPAGDHPKPVLKLDQATVPLAASKHSAEGHISFRKARFHTPDVLSHFVVFQPRIRKRGKLT